MKKLDIWLIFGSSQYFSGSVWPKHGTARRLDLIHVLIGFNQILKIYIEIAPYIRRRGISKSPISPPKEYMSIIMLIMVL